MKDIEPPCGPCALPPGTGTVTHRFGAVSDTTRRVGTSEMHHLPCTVFHTGEARTEEFFLVHEKDRGGSGASNTLWTSFRGVLLEGRAVETDEQGGIAMYVRDSQGADTYDPFCVSDGFVEWCREEPPSDSHDTLLMALTQWPNVSNKLLN